MILHEDQTIRVEARKGLVTILDKATGTTRHATEEEADHWTDRWTRAAPGSLGQEVAGQQDPGRRGDDDGP